MLKGAPEQWRKEGGELVAREGRGAPCMRAAPCATACKDKPRLREPLFLTQCCDLEKAPMLTQPVAGKKSALHSWKMWGCADSGGNAACCWLCPQLLPLALQQEHELSPRQDSAAPGALSSHLLVCSWAAGTEQESEPCYEHLSPKVRSIRP